jgi:hypothetical protein
MTDDTKAPNWQPYFDTHTESACCGKVIPPCYYAGRWGIVGGWWRVGLQTFPSYWVSVGDASAAALVLMLCFYDVCATPTQAIGTGNSVVVAALLTYSLACHNSLWTLLIGIPFERALAYHRFTGVLTVGLGIWHAITAYVGTRTPDYLTRYRFSILDTGWACEGPMILLGILSLPYVRRNFFELFYRMHVPLAMTAAIGGILHAWPKTLEIMGPGVGLWVVDIAIRVYYVRMIQGIAQTATIKQCTSSLVCLSIPKDKWVSEGVSG